MKTPQWKTIRRLRRIESRCNRRSVREGSKCREHDSLLVELEERVYAPIHLSLNNEHQSALASFLEHLRIAVSSGLKVVRLDFRRTEMVFSEGMLLFYSELQRLRDMYPRSVFACSPSKVDRVNQVLQHLGVFALLGYQSAVVPNRPDVITWRALSSAEYEAKAVGELIEMYASLKGERARHLFRSVTEAMGNAVRHAYMEPRKDGLKAPVKKKWWMFVREGSADMTVAICDLGIGIPRSLPIKHPAEFIQAAIAKVSSAVNAPTHRGKADANMIHAAMEINRTRTGVAGRGKGLRDLQRIVDEVPGGRLMIISNRGRLIYSNGVFSRYGYERSIKGTLVLWTIPLI